MVCFPFKFPLGIFFLSLIVRYQHRKWRQINSTLNYYLLPNLCSLWDKWFDVTIKLSVVSASFLSLIQFGCSIFHVCSGLISEVHFLYNVELIFSSHRGYVHSLCQLFYHSLLKICLNAGNLFGPIVDIYSVSHSPPLCHLWSWAESDTANMATVNFYFQTLESVLQNHSQHYTNGQLECLVKVYFTHFFHAVFVILECRENDQQSIKLEGSNMSFESISSV